MPPLAAAMKGAREIAFAIIAMTHHAGRRLRADRLPRPAAPGGCSSSSRWTLAGAVLVSGFVALTLSPMMCSTLLRHHRTARTIVIARSSAVSTASAPAIAALLASRCTVRWLLCWRGPGVAGIELVLFESAQLRAGADEDRGTIVASASAARKAPRSATPTATPSDRGDLQAPSPEVARYYVVAGFPAVTQGIAFVRLVPWDERERSQQQIVAELQPKLFAASRACSPSRSTRPRWARARRPSRSSSCSRPRSPTRSCRRHGRCGHGRGAEQPGPAQSRHRPEAQQAASSR